MLRPHAGDRGVGFEPVGENHLYPLGAEHNVKIGEDSAFVDDDDPGADALLGVLTPGFVRCQPPDANNGRSNDLVRFPRGRWKRVGLQRMKHGGADIFLGDLAWRRGDRRMFEYQQQSEHPAGCDPQQPFMACAKVSPRKADLLTGDLSGRALAHLIETFELVRLGSWSWPPGHRRSAGAVECYLFHMWL